MTATLIKMPARHSKASSRPRAVTNDPGSLIGRADVQPPVHAFLDLSNIWVGIAAAAAENGEAGMAVRLSAPNLATLLRAGRGPLSQVTVATADVPGALVGHFARFGDVILRERGRLTGSEQANDETLQVRMYETLHRQPRGVLVLATGDGAGSRQGRGFIPALEAARRHKWAVEVVGWGGSTNRLMIEWIKRVGGSFVDLRDHYYSVTFVDDGIRHAQPVLLHRRPTAA